MTLLSSSGGAILPFVRAAQWYLQDEKRPQTHFPSRSFYATAHALLTQLRENFSSVRETASFPFAGGSVQQFFSNKSAQKNASKTAVKNIFLNVMMLLT